MVRSVRTKKPLSKYPEGEYVMNSKSMRKSPKKSTELVKSAKNVRVEAAAKKNDVEATEKLAAKGNLQIDGRTLKAIRKPVLRDRTNLPGDRLKAVLLMKQGTIDEAAKKSTGSSRKASEAATLTSSSKPTKRSVRTTRKIIDEVEEERGSSPMSSAKSKKIPKVDKSEVESDDKPVKRKSSRKTVKLINESPDESKKSSRTSEAKNMGKPMPASDACTNVVTGKKFFKSKPTVATGEMKKSPIKKIFGKRRNIGAREKARASVSFRLRQTTLSESFAKQASKKILRPRKQTRNYCEESRILTKDESKSPTKSSESRKSGPIYKSVKLLNDSVTDKGDVFEFPYDSNDSREKLRKKTRKRIVTRKGKGSGPKKMTKTAKTTKVKQILKTDVVEPISANLKKPTEAISSESAPNCPMEVDEIQTNPNDNSTVVNEAETTNTEKRQSLPRIVESVELKGNERVDLTTTPLRGKISETNRRMYPAKTGNCASAQYRTMMNHALLNKTISPILVAMENFDPGSPWRPPIIPNQQFSRVRNIVQSTPQMKKFSSIIDKVENVARMEKMKTVARVERVEKMEGSEKMENIEKLKNVEGSEKIENVEKLKNVGRSEKIENVEKLKNVEGSEKIENVAKLKNVGGSDKTENVARLKNVENSERPEKVESVARLENQPRPKKKSRNEENTQVLEKSPKKTVALVKSPRKFGTVISNVNAIDPIAKRLNSEDSGENRISPKSTAIQSSIPDESFIAMSYGQPEITNNFNDDVDDKENSVPSPKKSPLKNSNRSPLKPINKSPLKSLNKSPLKDAIKISSMSDGRPKKSSSTENMEPRAGTSNAKKTNDDSRILRQSNLDNFLNLDEMPKSTRIITAHGIFADAHSTPISGKPTRRMTKDANIANAFGFDDFDDSEVNVSPITRPLVEPKILPPTKVENVQGKKSIPAPARLSIGDIKKHLLPTRKKPKVSDDPIVERIEEEVNEDQAERKETLAKNANIPDLPVTDVSDAQDENSKSNDKSVLEVPLFGDPEPVHFKQAPRYSYKRKRAVGFFLEDEQDENQSPPASPDKHATKKRKINKVERERQKQMEDWAKNLNQTFDEIDHFDLVVE